MFGMAPTCVDVNQHTASSSQIDVLVGFQNGDIFWFGASPSRYSTSIADPHPPRQTQSLPSTLDSTSRESSLPRPSLRYSGFLLLPPTLPTRTTRIFFSRLTPMVQCSFGTRIARTGVDSRRHPCRAASRFAILHSLVAKRTIGTARIMGMDRSQGATPSMHRLRVAHRPAWTTSWSQDPLRLTGREALRPSSTLSVIGGCRRRL